MATEVPFPQRQSLAPAHTSEAVSFLAPIERPKGLILRIMFWFSRRQWGKVPRPFSVFVARMPTVFGSFFGKVSRLDKKLVLPAETAIEREICEIVWLVSNEHLYNLNNLGLNIGSDGLCQVSKAG